MKRKINLNEESLQHLVEKCVYNIINEDIDEGRFGNTMNTINNVTKNLANGNYMKKYQQVIAKIRQYQRAIEQLKKLYNITNDMLNNSNTYMNNNTNQNVNNQKVNQNQNNQNINRQNTNNQQNQQNNRMYKQK